MTKGHRRKSPPKLRTNRRRQQEHRRREASRHLLLEPLEKRELLAVGPQIIGVQPNDGELLSDGDVRNIALRDLTFQFNNFQEIDETTLGAIQVTRAGSDGQFDFANARTDFNTDGAVIVEFTANTAGPRGNEISLLFSKSDRGGPAAPRIDVSGKTIIVELNTNRSNETRVTDLVSALNAHPDASELLTATLIAGPLNTNIASPAINYSPVDVIGANAASASTSFNTGGNLDVKFTAVQTGMAGNGLTVEFNKINFGGAAPPLINVDSRTITVTLNSTPGVGTTPAQLVSVFNSHPQASALMTVANPVGDPDAEIGLPDINYSPLILGGADDESVAAGFVGLGDSDREVVFRFAEAPVDGLYRVDIIGVGANPLRNTDGAALGDRTDDGIDNGSDYSLEFELDLGAKILAVVPQPVVRTSNGALAQAANQIEIYFNDDDLDPIFRTNPEFYKLIFTNETVENTDDRVYKPIAVQYFEQTDRVLLTFSAPLHQLGSGEGTFRLRVGTDETLSSSANPISPTFIDLTDTSVGSSFAGSHDLGELNSTQIISSSIQPQVYGLDFPGSSDEPGHRGIDPSVERHLNASQDVENGLTTLFYNFRADYGATPEGTILSNLITPQQKDRAREIFEIYAQQLGVQFIETQSQGFTIATGDLRALDSTVPTGPLGVLGAAGTSILNNQPMLVMDNAEDWYDGFGASDDPNIQSWFDTAVHEIGHLIGLGHTYDLPPGTIMGEQPNLGFGQTAEAVYPGDHDVVHGQHLHRPEGTDIDVYQFEIGGTVPGTFTAETIAQRRDESSLLDTAISIYRQQADGSRLLIAHNDDYFSKDSFLKLELNPGVYFVGVSSSGNEDYNPEIEDSGIGGTSEGEYDLRLGFRGKANSSILDRDNKGNEDTSELSQGTPLDGDGDGVPGGVFNHWFRVDATPIFVDKSAPAGGNGLLATPYNEIDRALAAARAGDVVRIVGNGGGDGLLETVDDNSPYLVGFDNLGRELADGSSMEIPAGVSVVIDRGAILKMRRSRIGVGSSSPVINRNMGSLQVLGTPRLLNVGGNLILDDNGNSVPGSVFFTSLNDDEIGGDSSANFSIAPTGGDWGGLIFRNDIDRAAGREDFEQQGAFLNYVNGADMRYGGGTVLINGVPFELDPIYAVDARPTITNNTIQLSGNAAISANPDSFEETNFHSPEFQQVPFTSDYTRVGPDIHGNRIFDNSINGLFIRTSTPAANALEEMTVTGRFDDTDIVHVVAEQLRIQGAPGGPLQTLRAPRSELVTVTAEPGGELAADTYDYKIVFVTADGEEGPPSDGTASVVVDGTQSVLLTDIPAATGQFVARRIYRLTKDNQYILVAEINATDTTYLDDGTTAGGLLFGSTLQLNKRLGGSLIIDPGSILKFNGAGIETGFGTQLVAEGTDGNEVVFTSILDSRYGVGGSFTTSQDGDLQAGDWTGLFIRHTSSASIDNAVFAYGGGVSEVPGNFAGFNVLEIHQAAARVANSKFEFNANGTGGQSTANRSGLGTNAEAVVFVRGAQPVFIDNVIRDNFGAAINIDVNSLNSENVTDHGRTVGLIGAIGDNVGNHGPLIQGNAIGGNDINGMVVRGGTLTTQGVWDDHDIAHVINNETIYVTDHHTYGGLRLESSSEASLVIKLEGANAGFTATGQALDITDRSGGSLQVLGQPGYPVVLTSLDDDSATAGFDPSGNPQGDTNNDADVTFDGPLPTGPEVDNGVLIDNDVDPAIPGHFEFEPLAGGSYFGSGITAQGNQNLFTNIDSIFAFENYIDTDSDGAAVGLSTTTITMPPTLISPDLVASEGNFAGPNGTVNWRVESHFNNGEAVLFNTVTLTSDDPANALGNIQFINYLDEDVTMIGAQDILAPVGTPGQADFRAFTLDDDERIGFSQGGVYEPGPGLVNATYDGWTADLFADLEIDILGPGTTYSIPGNIDLVDLPAIPDQDFGTVYGPGDVTTAFAWTVDPAATTATITSFLELLPRDPIDPEPVIDPWRSVRLDNGTADRNAAVVVESETGNISFTGTNNTAATSQFIGAIAPYESAGDENLRLAFEIHGTINQRSDVDVYSFDADSGTEVWLDIDRTTHSLDTVVELIDSNGRLLARSNDSGAESDDPSLLLFDATVFDADDVNPLNKSPFVSRDLYTTNPRDAGMRVVLPGPAGTNNTYHVRVRSTGQDLDNVQGGMSDGVYQLQVRLQEVDELPGSTIHMADIRYATVGIEVMALPAHSPLAGEASENVDILTGLDTNDLLTTADGIGNVLGSDRGAISVAGQLSAADDVDWYQFDLRYLSTQNEFAGSADTSIQNLATIFDIDYADGFARPNTSLWVFNDQGQLILSSRDSNVTEDRPAGLSPDLSDLSRGSIGALDPFIGSVNLPAFGANSTGVYYVAITSNAQVPEEFQQFLTPTAVNPFIRLEPINSIVRVAEDHGNNLSLFSTAEAPQIPVLFGQDDQVTLIAPQGSELIDGETFTITNKVGNSVTYEFDLDSTVEFGHIAIPYDVSFDKVDVAISIADTIFFNPPASPAIPSDPTAPLIEDEISIFTTVPPNELVIIGETYSVTKFDGLGFPSSFSSNEIAAHVRQNPAPGQATPKMSISRPAAKPFTLGDVTLFLTTESGFIDRTTLVTVDPFSGQLETIVGGIDTNLEDIALRPDGGLFGFNTPDLQSNDANSGNYFQVDPGSATPLDLSTNLGDDGIETYQADPMNPAAAVRSNGNAGVGIGFNGVTFSTPAVSNNVRGFAIGNRLDLFSPGIVTPNNALFEFNPQSGAAVNPPGTGNRGGGALLQGAGTQIVERAVLDTSVDAVPPGGANTVLTGIDATTFDFFNNVTTFDIEDGDFFQIDTDGDFFPDQTFEFDSGPEFYMDVDTSNPTNLVILRDGDSFTVDGMPFEFDTGSVLVVTATNGNQITDGDTISITDNATNPTTVTFEFDNNGNSGGNSAIAFNNNNNQQAIITAIITAINNAGNFQVQAVQMPGTNRITLLNENATSGATVVATGISLLGAPGVSFGATRIPVEEIFTETEIATALTTVIDGTQGTGFTAGALENRVNFMNALTADFSGVFSPVFTTVHPLTNSPTGQGGTLVATNNRVPFLANDTASDIATRVLQSLNLANLTATQIGASVFLDQNFPQPTVSCFDTGISPTCPLLTGGVAPGGNVTGIAFVGPRLYAVTDAGGLFEVVSSFSDPLLGTTFPFDPDSNFNVGDYIETSGALLSGDDGAPIQFAGLTAGPVNTEDGRYAEMLFGIDINGKLYAFDTAGELQNVFVDGQSSVDTGFFGATGIAFSNLDDNLWHTSEAQSLAPGHGVSTAFDDSRLGEDPTTNTSYYFGYVDEMEQPQFGENNYAPTATQANSYDFIGGAQGSLVSNPFSLEGYSGNDLPTLYFNYFLETENANADLENDDLMRDAFRVFVSGDDGRWRLLATNNSQVDPFGDDGVDEFDPFVTVDPITGAIVAEQPFARSETFDTAATWRQARLDLSPYAGQDNLRLRFDFSTAGGFSTGGIDFTTDLNTAGNELRAIPAAELRDGQTFIADDLIVDDLTGDISFGEFTFEIEMGPTIVAPTGSAINDGDTFIVDGTTYEFDQNGSSGATDSIPHTRVPFVGTETAAQLAAVVEAVLTDPATRPTPVEITGDLSSNESNDTIQTAVDSGLIGVSRSFVAIGQIGDNPQAGDFRNDVDMIELRLDKGDTVTVTTNTTRVPSSLDSYVRLFDADGVELASNDDIDPTNPISRDSQVMFTAAQRGVYYVGISGSHYSNYLPDSIQTGTAEGVTSFGPYEVNITVADSIGPQRVGNRLNLPNAGTITTTDLPTTFVEGGAGVGTHDPTGLGVTRSNIPVRIHSGMTSESVADAIQVALADEFAGGQVEAFKTSHEVVNVVGHHIIDAGPLGLSGPSDPTTAVPGSGLFGDRFGAFSASTDFDGQTILPDLPGALRMRDNAFQGVYIDDVIIGFAARGEMITDSNPAQDPVFVANTGQPDDEIDTGAYQLEIRQGASYATDPISDDPNAPPTMLYDSFDVKDRLSEQASLVVDAGHQFADGQTFSLTDGIRQIQFEFDDLSAANGVANESIPIPFNADDGPLTMARRIRDAINQAYDDGLIDVRAASGDGVVQGTTSTSNRINLFGNAVIGIGLTTTAGEEEANAPIETGIVGGGREAFHATGFIGDDANLDILSADFDVFKVDLLADEIITIDIDASENLSPLDSILRVFDVNGNPVMVTDAFGDSVPVESDDTLAPGEDALILPETIENRDPYIAFTAPADGTYYIGVSGFDNNDYDVNDPDSGRAGMTGEYEITIARPFDTNGLTVLQFDDTGDENLPRQQGQLVISSNRVTDSEGFGIVVNGNTPSAVGSPTPGAVRNLAKINTSKLIPGVVISNNILAENALGGIDLSGTTPTGSQPDSIPFARVMNNTIVGLTEDDGTLNGDIGIRISNGASPTLLNNVLSFIETGIDVDASSSTTVIGGTLYHNVDAPANNIGQGSFARTVDSAVQIFVDREGGNYYPASGSPIIDSSIDSLEDRQEMLQVRGPLGIPPSPILAPTLDANGQRRSDDLTVAPPPGLGEDVFKDRGALDRSDFDGPRAQLVNPLDNGADDIDPSVTLVNLIRASLREFSIQLADGDVSQGGSGIDDSTVTSNAVRIVQDDRTLVEGEDYQFSYDTTNNIVRLTPLSGVWDLESNYVLHMSNEDHIRLFGRSGDSIFDGDLFDVTDLFNNTLTFEYDSGYVIEVPESYTVTIPLLGAATGGIADGDEITVDDGTTFTTFEFDNNGVVGDENVQVAFDSADSRGEIADNLVTALRNAAIGLSPRNLGEGAVQIGVNGTQEVTVSSTTIGFTGGMEVLQSGDLFTVDDGTRVVTFQFNQGGSGGGSTVGIPYDFSRTNDEVAASIAAAINGAGLGLNTTALDGGRVHVGGTTRHIVDTGDTALVLDGEPGVREDFGIKIPTVAGSFQGLLLDTETFTLSDTTGNDVTFELDNNQSVTPGNTPIPFTGTTTTSQLANTIVSRIQSSGFGLFPSHFGDGIVRLGSDGSHLLDMTDTGLTQVGEPGLSAARAIPFVPDATFTSQQVAANTANTINTSGLIGVSAEVQGDEVVVRGAVTAVGFNVTNVSQIQDIAGNRLQANQPSGTTRFTIFIGAGLDYGDAPEPYPTLRADNGARHEVLPGFSLGNIVDVNADGLPSPNADGDDNDGDDEDGVFFNPATPLIPNRTISVTVDTSGIGIGGVVPFGVLDAWIDYNRDGDWDDSGEKIIRNEILNESVLDANGSVTFSNIRVPANASLGTTFARFRLSTVGGVGPSGEGSQGEVEDHLVTIAANPWQNPVNRFDVNNNGTPSPIDVLSMINYINEHPGNSTLPLPKPAGANFLDVTGDGLITALDVLQAINEINRLNEGNSAGGEGESVIAIPDPADAEGEASPLTASSQSLRVRGAEFELGRLSEPADLTQRVFVNRAVQSDLSINTLVSTDDRVYQTDAGSSLANDSQDRHLDDVLADDGQWLDIFADVDDLSKDGDVRDSIFMEMGWS